MKEIIASKIKHARKEQGYNQDDFVKLLDIGWSHQILSEIENGRRDVKAWELLRIANALHLDLSYFFASQNISKNIKQFVLWRDRDEKAHKRKELEFLKHCRDYKIVEELAPSQETISIHSIPRKKIDLKDFRFEEAIALAEEVRDLMNLGDYPGFILKKILEEKFKVKFIFIDLGENGSAASYVGDEGDCILINASEVAWRQNFSISHELFHLITWDNALFSQIENNKTLWDKNESLANTFAAGLLLPKEILEREIKEILKEKFTKASFVLLARKFDVSLVALLWRLQNLGYLNEGDRKKLQDDAELKNLDKKSLNIKKVENIFLSDRFVRLAYECFSLGNLSEMRLADMLDVNIADLPATLARYGYCELANNEIQNINARC